MKIKQLALAAALVLGAQSAYAQSTPPQLVPNLLGTVSSITGPLLQPLAGPLLSNLIPQLIPPVSGLLGGLLGGPLTSISDLQLGGPNASGTLLGLPPLRGLE